MMKNMNKNLINLSLGILAIFAVGIFLSPAKANAYVYYQLPGYEDSYNPPVARQPVVYQEPVVYQPAPVYRPAPVYQAAPVYQTTPVYQNTTYTNSTQNDNTTNSNSDTTSTTTSKVTSSDYKKITANALFGTHSFLPSGLVQWVLLAIFILVIVILLRRALGVEERYQSEPLKHA